MSSIGSNPDRRSSELTDTPLNSSSSTTSSSNMPQIAQGALTASLSAGDSTPTQLGSQGRVTARSSAAASSSMDVHRSQPLATEAPPHKREHKGDLITFEALWKVLKENAQTTQPYNPDLEPMLYGQFVDKGRQFTIECRTRLDFRTNAAKTTKEEVTRQQATRNGTIVTQGTQRERTYHLDPQFIAE